MAKQTSLFGKISGKLGAVVFSSSGGETISREYNPNVSNPNTDAQVNQRARMKLMSQLSAVFAPVITMRKEGLVSARNRWVKANFAYSDAIDGQAQISYENIQLTSSSTALPQIVYGQNATTQAYELSLQNDASAIVDRVVYVIYRKTQDGTLQYYQSVIVTEAGDNGTFPYVVTLNDNFVVYAYGMRDTNAKATAKYYNYSVTTANDLAQLIASRQIDTADYALTQTRGASINNGDPIEPTPTGQARVYVTALGPGTVSGGGTFTVGDTVTVTATPNANATFVGWKRNGYNGILSTSNPYSFELNGLTDLIGVFEGEGNESL
jgi:hypothetical protein